MQLRRTRLREAQPVQVRVERPVGVDTGLDAELGGAELDGLVDPPCEFLLGVLVGVGRALALTESAEGAADDADVGHVDTPSPQPVPRETVPAPRPLLPNIGN